MRHAQHIGLLILAAQREGNRRLAQALRPLGVTPSQAEVLRLLSDGQPMTLTELGRLLVCEGGNNPSRLVDRLVSADLVCRVEGRRDRRQVHLTLTPAGERAAHRIAEIEQQTYEATDAAGAGYDVDNAIRYLSGLTTDQPSGLAVQRRVTFDAAKRNVTGLDITGVGSAEQQGTERPSGKRDDYQKIGQSRP
jgi:DNA-binding MarR family transcriptional regulator